MRGAKKRPFYLVVASDSRKRRDSGYIERIGYFNPRAREHETRLALDRERYDYWLGQGAKPSERVAALAKSDAAGMKTDAQPQATETPEAAPADTSTASAEPAETASAAPEAAPETPPETTQAPSATLSEKSPAEKPADPAAPASS